MHECSHIFEYCKFWYHNNISCIADLTQHQQLWIPAVVQILESLPVSKSHEKRASRVTEVGATESPALKPRSRLFPASTSHRKTVGNLKNISPIADDIWWFIASIRRTWVCQRSRAKPAWEFAWVCPSRRKTRLLAFGEKSWRIWTHA